MTFLVSDQGGAINHRLFMQMIRSGEATFDIDEPIRIKITADGAKLKRINEAFDDFNHWRKSHD